MYLIIERFCPIGSRKATRNQFANMKQGAKQLIDFFNQKTTIFFLIYRDGEIEDSFDYFNETFLQGINNLELARKIQECTP